MVLREVALFGLLYVLSLMDSDEKTMALPGHVCFVRCPYVPMLPAEKLMQHNFAD